MSNANRDYAIVYDVKNSTLVLNRPLVFYITDKNTSNIFVRLVTKIIVGDGIDQYTDIENATNYILTMRVIKPNDEIKSVQATQHEPESLFQFDLTEDFKDIPGKYICELIISTIVNGRQELITSDAFNYEVKRSILSKVNIIEGKGTTIEKLLNDLDATKAKLSSQIINKAEKDYVDAKVSSVASGSPKGVFPTLADLKNAKPTGDSGIYITRNDGNWNYWNGNDWVSGGVYQATKLSDSSISPNHFTDNTKQYIWDLCTYNQTLNSNNNYEGKNLIKSSFCNNNGGVTRQQLVNDSTPFNNYDLKVHKINYTTFGARNWCYFGHNININSGQLITGAWVKIYDLMSIDGLSFEFLFNFYNSDNQNIQNGFDNGISFTVDELTIGNIKTKKDTNSNINFLAKINSIKDNWVHISFGCDKLYDNTANVVIYGRLKANSAGIKGSISLCNWVALNDYSIYPLNNYDGDDIPKSEHGILNFIDEKMNVGENISNEIPLNEIVNSEHNYGVSLKIDNTIDIPYSFEDVEGALKLDYTTSSNKYSYMGYKLPLSGENINTFGIWVNTKNINSNVNSISIVYNFYDENNNILNGADTGYNIAINELVEGRKIEYIVEGKKYNIRIKYVKGDWIYLTSTMNELYSNTKSVLIAFKIITSEVSTGTMYVCNPTFVKNASSLEHNIIYTNDKTPKTKKGIINLFNAQSILYKKSYCALGDSLTYGHLAGNGITYVTKIGNKYNMNYTNFGLNGSRITTGNTPEYAMCLRYKNMPQSDYITVWGGINDFFKNAELGSIDSTDTSTFRGALNVLCKGLLDKYPTSKIAFFTPLNSNNYANSLGLYPVDYVDSIIEICKKYSIPVLDLYRTGGINLNNSAQKNALSYNNNDNTHLNDAGYKHICNKIECFLKSL